MKITELAIPGVLLVEPRIFRDDRGYFLETFHAGRYGASGVPGSFLQDNVSVSRRGVLRGLHYQWPNPQGKLVMVLEGEVLDVAVDVRRGSPTFGKSVSARLRGETHEQLWVPEGFAHGFYVVSETAVVSYKCTSLYSPADDASLLWSDEDVAIDWPAGERLLSDKDARAPRLRDIPEARLPDMAALAALEEASRAGR